MEANRSQAQQIRSRRRGWRDRKKRSKERDDRDNETMLGSIVCENTGLCSPLKSKVAGARKHEANECHWDKHGSRKVLKRIEKAAEVPSTVQTPSAKHPHITEKRFDELRGVVSAPTLRAVREVLGYEVMTKVQAEALPICCEGRDVVAKAKTGTGKTVSTYPSV